MSNLICKSCGDVLIIDGSRAVCSFCGEEMILDKVACSITTYTNNDSISTTIEASIKDPTIEHIAKGYIKSIIRILKFIIIKKAMQEWS